MKIILVRHGKTKSNDLKITQGWMDNKLTDLNNEGFEQAKKVAERLREEKIDMIYSSDLKRASRTAEEIAKHHRCKLIYDSRIREQSKGKYEGKLNKEIWKDLEESGEDIREWTPEGGESWRDVDKRVLDFLNDIGDKQKNQTILIISHGGPLATMSRYFHDDWDFDGEKLMKSPKKSHSHRNASVSEYVFDKGIWKIGKLNCVEHLE